MSSGCRGRISCASGWASYFLSMDAGPGGYVVALSGPDRAHHTAPEASAEDAYGRALLYVVSQVAAAAR